jgi:hypothetical protein
LHIPVMLIIVVPTIKMLIQVMAGPLQDHTVMHTPALVEVTQIITTSIPVISIIAVTMITAATIIIEAYTLVTAVFTAVIAVTPVTPASITVLVVPTMDAFVRSSADVSYTESDIRNV